jgi:hypothetical protein
LVINSSSWLNVSPNGGTLSAGAPAATAHVSLNASAGSLLPGSYSASIFFSNVTDHSSQTRQFILKIPYGEDFHPYSSTISGFSPLGYWRLNETNAAMIGGTALNLGNAGHAADGVFSGALAWVTGALRGDADTAVGFNGASEITVPHIPALTLNPPFTIEAWVTPTTVQTNGNLVCPLACGEFGTNRSGWLIYQSATGWNFRMYDQNGMNASLNIETGGAPVPGIWYHIAAVYDGSAGQIYVNGNSGAATPAGFVASTNAALTIGTRSDTNFFFSGSVDEVAIYNQALTPSNIVAHYQAGTNSSPQTPYDQRVLGGNPMIYLRLDAPGPLSVAANDGSLGANANGIYQAGAVPGVPGSPVNGFGATNHACLFNGLVGYVGVPGENLNVTGPLTIVAWVKANPANGLFQTIVGKGDTSYRLDMNQNGYPGFSDGAQTFGDLFGPNPIDDGQWHQLMGVYDGSNTEQLYVDGQLAASTSAATIPVAGSAFDLWLGGAPDYGPARMFSGLVDEVAVFSTALSSNQARLLYNSAFSTPPVLTAVSPVGNTFNLTWTSLTGRTYQVQYRTNVAELDWNNLGVAVQATNSVTATSDPSPASLQRFYRVTLLP